jgi:hypothetical protein
MNRIIALLLFVVGTQSAFAQGTLSYRRPSTNDVDAQPN